MTLFDVVPDRFFSILSSKNKVLYSEALFIIRDALNEDMSIRRQDLIGRIASRLEFMLESSDLGEDDDSFNNMKSPYDRANAVFNILKDRGWIEVEYLSDTRFEEMVNVPDYAFEIINVLYRIVHQEKGEYKGYVYSTYAALMQLKEQPEYSYTALLASYQRTNEFINALSKLFSNIRRYHLKISSLDVNALLEDHFGRYQTEVMKIIEPIRTNDSVPRFKGRILEILEGWRESETDIDMLVRQGMSGDRYKDEAECKEDILRMIDSVVQTYHSVEKTIHRVEDKHSAYTKASVERIRYKLNTGRDLQGIITRLIAASSDDEVSTMMSDAINLSLSQQLSSSSLYARKERSIREKADLLPFELYRPTDEARNGVLEALRSAYSDDAIDKYVRDNLDAGHSSSEDFTISDDREYILFLLSTIRGSERSAPFIREFMDRRAEREGFSLPMIRYYPKEKK